MVTTSGATLDHMLQTRKQIIVSTPIMTIYHNILQIEATPAASLEIYLYTQVHLKAPLIIGAFVVVAENISRLYRRIYRDGLVWTGL